MKLTFSLFIASLFISLNLQAQTSVTPTGMSGNALSIPKSELYVPTKLDGVLYEPACFGQNNRSSKNPLNPDAKTQLHLELGGGKRLILQHIGRFADRQRSNTMILSVLDSVQKVYKNSCNKYCEANPNLCNLDCEKSPDKCFNSGVSFKPIISEDNSGFANLLSTDVNDQYKTRIKDWHPLYSAEINEIFYQVLDQNVGTSNICKSTNFDSSFFKQAATMCMNIHGEEHIAKNNNVVNKCFRESLCAMACSMDVSNSAECFNSCTLKETSDKKRVRIGRSWQWRTYKKPTGFEDINIQEMTDMSLLGGSGKVEDHCQVFATDGLSFDDIVETFGTYQEDKKQNITLSQKIRKFENSFENKGVKISRCFRGAFHASYALSDQEVKNASVSAAQVLSGVNTNQKTYDTCLWKSGCQTYWDTTLRYTPKYYGIDGKLDSKIQITKKPEKNFIHVRAQYPGADGYCGGYHSPLMVFQDYKHPKFNKKSHFLSHKQTFWPEENHQGYFLVQAESLKAGVTSPNQLFGDNGNRANPNGFKKLLEYDDNKDKKIDAKDPIFQKLYLWKDKNSDGIGTSDELISVAKFGLIELDVNETFDPEYQYNIDSRAMFKGKSKIKYMSKGKVKTGSLVDVYFAYTDSELHKK
ncbi:MAG: hypothetical protein ACPGJV_03565 [Bacteriovoracaceae bacterium]